MQPAQVTVELAVGWLSVVATQPLRAEPGAQQACPASQAALDALQLLYRDDGPDFKILAKSNVLFLASQLEASKVLAGKGTSSASETQRCDLTPASKRCPVSCISDGARLMKRTLHLCMSIP